jgi:FKBP-type peptidyl-prolyl cis-trans isomerase FkpA/FKBP-type peptidyl-prolyl cis-trans isomerase FklB
MKLKQVVLLAIGLAPLALAAQPAPSTPIASTPLAAPAPAAMPEKGKLSYAIGMYFGNNITNSIKRGDLDIDKTTLLQALSDVVNDKPTQLTEKDVRDIFGQLRAAMQAKQKAKDDEAKAKSDAFLAQYAKGADVITLTNGIEYKVLTQGSGPTPKETDSVVVAYKGTLIDGTEFDHNDNFRTPIRGRVIPGWQKILPLMSVGSKWEVVIPSGLAYGPRGRPPMIPGFSALIFDMELKSIAPAAPPMASFSPTAPGSNPGGNTPVVSGQIIKVPSADELKKGAQIEVITNPATQH